MKKLGFSSYSYWKNLQLKQFILRYFNIIPVHLKWDQRKEQSKVRIKNCLEKKSSGDPRGYEYMQASQYLKNLK